jgi:serine/threonine protein kinase
MSRPTDFVDFDAATLVLAPSLADDDTEAASDQENQVRRPRAGETQRMHRGRFEGEKRVEATDRVAVDATSWPVEATGFDQRYQTRSVLGEGGMGEVRLCRDRLVGRDVALKVLRPNIAALAEGRERFVREARVQGQLEHPAVVPVYDLGVAPDGGAYFTMKRIRGETLDEIARLLGSGDAEAAAKYTPRRLLTAFGSVCLAIDFAHQRGVLHRDLKPANIILGDFGEVYVLDWGLAKVADVNAPIADPINHLEADEHTQQGTMLGTPGYMAPEQVLGAIDQLDARTDVYALGVVLFEILAFEPLHRGLTVESLLASTLRGADARPSARGCPDVPPELEAICARATARDPADRYPTARALSDALDRVLDGNRNEELRRDLARGHVEAAHAALARSGDGEEVRAARALALREAASALALDPSNVDALGTMAKLLMDVPDEVPREAQAGLDAAAAAARRDAAKMIATRFVGWSAFLPLALWMGVRSYPITIGAVAAVIVCGVISLVISRSAAAGVRQGAALLVISSATIALMSALFGPFIVIPGLAATNTMFFAMNADRPARRVVLVVGVLVVLVPFGLELLGALPRAYAFSEGLLQVLPRATEFPALQTMLCLALVSIAMIIIPCLAVGRLRDRLSVAERRLYLQAWNLSQLVPSAARQPLVGTRRAAKAVSAPR